MTATEELRAMLDERGVEWSSIGGDTAWEDSRGWTATVEADSVDGSMVYVTALMTPEQAVEATLGRGNVGRYVGLRQGKYWERTENSDYYCGGCGWKVTDHDSYCPECGGALHEATLGPREQPPYDELIEALRRDWDIEASWDGLRRFWYVGLTDEGVRKRDEREATLGRGVVSE